MKNKIIAIGDIHGKDIWEKIVEKESNANKIIFMGDYFDSFDIPFEKQKDNFLRLLEYKLDNKDKVILLFGNHDFHYLNDNEHYSGYQSDHALNIGTYILRCIEDELIQPAYFDDGFLFTHAGVTKEWLTNNLEENEIVDSRINRLFKEKQSVFKFTPSNPFDNTGDSITQSPIWVRPRALMSNLPDGFKQVVGHTHQKNININDDVIFIDTLDYSNEYLIINNGVPEIGIIKDEK